MKSVVLDRDRAAFCDTTPWLPNVVEHRGLGAARDDAARQLECSVRGIAKRPVRWLRGGGGVEGHRLANGAGATASCVDAEAGQAWIAPRARLLLLAPLVLVVLKHPRDVHPRDLAVDVDASQSSGLAHHAGVRGAHDRVGHLLAEVDKSRVRVEPLRVARNGGGSTGWGAQDEGQLAGLAADAREVVGVDLRVEGEQLVGDARNEVGHVATDGDHAMPGQVDVLDVQRGGSDDPSCAVESMKEYSMMPEEAVGVVVEVDGHLSLLNVQ